jgi:hypothetical protein
MSAELERNVRAPGCGIIKQDLSRSPFAVSAGSWDEQGFSRRLVLEATGIVGSPTELPNMSYDSAALYPDGWVLSKPYAIDVKVLRTSPKLDRRGWPVDAGVRGEAEELLVRATYDVELAIFLAYMGRPPAEIGPHLEGVRASDTFEEQNREAIHRGFVGGSSGELGEAEERSHDDKRQSLHAGAGAAAMLAGDPAAEKWLTGGQPFMSSIVRHHLLLVASPRATPLDIEPEGGHTWGHYTWPHHDLFAKADESPETLGDALANARLTNPTILRELAARTGQTTRLHDWVEHRFPAPCWDCGAFALAANVGARLLAARSVRDEALARALEPVADRLIEVILKRDGAPELFVLERDPARR